MGSRIDRALIVLAVVLSVALTALTLAAVARQGDTLRERELADLRDSAGRAAASHMSDLRADLDRAFDAAARAWRMAELDGLDIWVGGQHDWLMAFCSIGPSPWTGLPFSASELALPMPADDAFAQADEAEFTEQDPAAALARFERLVEGRDPVTRVRAFLAAGAARRKLRDYAGGARDFQLAADLMRSDERLIRLMLGAQLAGLDCLISAGESESARVALDTLLETMNSAHPARFSSADVAMVRRRAMSVAALASSGSAGEIGVDGGGASMPLLREAERRARLRDAVATIGVDLGRIYSSRNETPAGNIWFMTANVGLQRSVVVAVRSIAPDRFLALTAPARDVVERYWGQVDPSAPWYVVLPGEVGAQETIRALGDAFGGAQLVPTPGTVARMTGQSFYGLVLLVATTGGTAAAWGVVIWTMLRVMARQRELVKLQRRFVADVSHELKTPLALIRLLSETLHSDRISDPQRKQHYLATITRESERLSVLLDSILDFSRVESGRKQYNFDACDVGVVAEQAWSLYEPQFAADGFKTGLAIAPNLPQIRGDGQALQQLLVNLLQNAHRYSGEGRYVRLAVDRVGEFLEITVEDHGIGMSRSQVKRLGDSFYRAPDPRVRKTRGTGLGLAIVNHIVRAHRGRMEVQSRPAKGSTFIVRLPIIEPG